MPVNPVFINNHSQAVCLPESVRKVDVRVNGHEHIIAPLGRRWDRFFLNDPAVSDDFMPERAHQFQSERESL